MPSLTEADYQDIALAVAMSVQLIIALFGVGICVAVVAQSCDAPSRFDHVADVPPPYIAYGSCDERKDPAQ